MSLKSKLATNSIVAKARDGYAKCKGAYYGAMATLATSSFLAPVLCEDTTTGVDMKEVFMSIMDILYTIAMFVGAAMVGIAIFNWVVAMKDDNADGQTRAVRNFVVGIALATLRVTLKPLLEMLIV